VLIGRGGALVPPPKPPGITTISYGPSFKYNNGFPTKYIASDTWSSTWAVDGNIYVGSNDTLGGWQGATSGGRNTLISKLDGYTTAMTGTLINSMDAWGTFTQTGSDGRTYKIMSLISVHGTLIAVMSRQLFNFDTSPQLLEYDTQLIRSADFGASWTPMPPSMANPYTSPTFPGPFGPLVFVQYGKDYVGQTVDGSDNYVYAVHFPFAWNNNDDMYLGRVPIAIIRNMSLTPSTSDWQWYQSGGINGTWGNYSSKVSVLHLPQQLCLSTAQWMPAFNCYLMVQWQYPIWNPVLDTTITYWDAYWAVSLVGPWHLIPGRKTWNPNGLYMPAVIPTSIVSDGGKTGMIITAGNFIDTGPTGDYTLTLVPFICS